MGLVPTHGRRAAALALALALAACGGGGGGQGGSPTLPVPTPAPPTGPTPDPPLSASCERLPLGSPTYTCRDDAARLESEVMRAIDTLKREHPEYFKGDTILNGPGYYTGLIRVLDRDDDLCAFFDGQELAVKRTNNFSEQYRLQTSWRTIRRAYMGVCYPAWFPVSRKNPPPSPQGCHLPPSYEVACDTLDSLFRGVVEAAIDQVLRERPELFDFNRKAPGRDWPLVKDFPAYYAALIEVLTGKGLCGKFDGEEIRVKQTNDLSEHFDVNYADQYIRRGPGIYRGTCYPAAF